MTSEETQLCAGCTSTGSESCGPLCACKRRQLRWPLVGDKRNDVRPRRIDPLRATVHLLPAVAPASASSSPAAGPAVPIPAVNWAERKSAMLPNEARVFDAWSLAPGRLLRFETIRRLMATCRMTAHAMRRTAHKSGMINERSSPPTEMATGPMPENIGSDWLAK
eukprot:4660680-Prymnesium_polylepis.1